MSLRVNFATFFGSKICIEKLSCSKAPVLSVVEGFSIHFCSSVTLRKKALELIVGKKSEPSLLSC